MIPQAGSSIEFETLTTIHRDQLKKYAVAAADPNPIHLDEAVAKKAGLPGVIAHGMLIAALIAQRAESFRQTLGSGWKLSRFKTRFSDMTYPGEEVCVGGAVSKSSDTSITIDLKACNAAGTTKVSGNIEFTNAR